MAPGSLTRAPWHASAPRPLVFKNASVVDPVEGKIREKQLVFVADGLIKKCRHHDDSLPTLAPEDYDVVDLKGKFLCPGLIDAHVHLVAPPGEPDLWRTLKMPHDVSLLRQPFYARQILLRGFTTVRDCGGATLALKQAIEEGLFTGPRVFLAGHALSQTGGHGDLRNALDLTDVCTCSGLNGAAAICDGAAECARMAREQIRTGADFLKIMAGGGVSSPADKVTHVQFTPEEIKAITQVASNAGTYTTAHAYTPQAIRHAIANGCKGIEHGNLLDKATAQLMQEKGIYLTPTLISSEAMAHEKFAGFLPSELGEKNFQVLQQGLQALEIADAAGVKMCFGTDLLGPLTSWQSKEFALRSWVIRSENILRSATVNAAEMMGVGDQLGQVKEGFLADLLVLDTNPLENISILSEPERHVLMVMKGGRVYKGKIPGLPKPIR